MNRQQERIYLSSPHMSEQGYEMDYIKEAFAANWISPMGENVTKFEEAVCQKVGCKAALAVSSGTAAIHLAIKLLDIGTDDLVFCQSLTFAATANPILYEKAVPVFIDSDKETWNMSPAALEAAFQKYEKVGRRPKAVILVHLYGLTANLDAILDICRKYDTPVIEDAAESLGTSYGSRMTGSFGRYGILSFNGNKIITSSGGGMLLCNGEDAQERAKKALFWSTQARDSARHYQHSELGYNYRMSNIVAGIGRGQMHVLDRRVEQKRAIYRYYEEAFQDIDALEMMPLQEERGRSNCWLSCALLDGGAAVRPEDIHRTLEKENIESRPVWKPMHLQPFFADYDYVDNGGTGADLFERGVCLPSDTKLSQEDLARVCRLIKGLFYEK